MLKVWPSLLNLLHVKWAAGKRQVLGPAASRVDPSAFCFDVVFVLQIFYGVTYWERKSLQVGALLFWTVATMSPEYRDWR